MSLIWQHVETEHSGTANNPTANKMKSRVIKICKSFVNIFITLIDVKS